MEASILLSNPGNSTGERQHGEALGDETSCTGRKDMSRGTEALQPDYPVDTAMWVTPAMTMNQKIWPVNPRITKNNKYLFYATKLWSVLFYGNKYLN